MISPPSNHGATSLELKRRGIEQGPVDCRSYDFDQEWDAFRDLCGSKNKSKWAWKKFYKVLSVSHELETNLESDLIDALAQALGRRCCFIEVGDSPHQKKIVFKKHKRWGFATQVSVKDRYLTRVCDDSTCTSSFDGRSRNDHACVLFEKCEENYKISDVTALVELKMSDPACHPIPTNKYKSDIVRATSGALDLAGEHGPIGQILRDVLDKLLICYVRNNVQPTDIPIMVLAGKRSNQNGTDKNLSYVRGDLHVPESFGDSFMYSLSSFGGFHDYKPAVAAYINTLRVGVETAKSALKKRLEEHSAMLCSYSHKLMGCSIKDCKLVASPVLDIKCGGLFSSVRINRGELFTAVLSGEFFLRNELSAIWISTNVQSSEQYEVVIKVSSAAVHRTLVEQCMTGQALMSLNSKYLGDVLLGVWSPDCTSLVMVMKNLLKEGYTALNPSVSPDLPALWAGWKQLVNNVLLPLAKKNVVHCDIRPGWDCTANIMSKVVDGEYHLRLIDYDSLATITAARKLTREDPRLFHVKDDDARKKMTGLEFLWWQCVLVAHTWYKRKNDSEMEKIVQDLSDGMIAKHFAFNLEEDRMFLNKIASDGEAVGVADLEKTMDIFSTIFSVQSLL